MKSEFAIYFVTRIYGLGKVEQLEPFRLPPRVTLVGFFDFKILTNENVIGGIFN